METKDALTRDTWPANTKVTALHVPWDANYRDVVVFDTPEERDAYFDEHARDGYTFRSDKFTYLRPNEPVTLPIPYSRAYSLNYLVAVNPEQPVPSSGPVRPLYYFITSTEYVAPSSTVVTLQLDVMMTYQFDICMGSSYVVAGHIGVSNANVDSNSVQLLGRTLRRYLTEPEGVSIGTEYSTVYRHRFSSHPSSAASEAGWTSLGLIVVTSTANLETDPGTLDAPSITCATGTMVDGLPSACNVYGVKSDDFLDMCEQLKDKSWVAQCIVSVSTFPTMFLNSVNKVGKLFGNGVDLYTFDSDTGWVEEGVEFNPWQYFLRVCPDAEFQNEVCVRDTFYKKFFTYPYSVIEVTSYAGSSLMLKPELFDGNTVAFKAIACALPPFATAAFMPVDHNLPSSGAANAPGPQDVTFTYTDLAGNERTGRIDKGDFLDTAVWLTDYPQFSIINNNYITYMASTANTRRYQYDNAAWQYNRASAAAQNAYDLATSKLLTDYMNYNTSLPGAVANFSDYVNKFYANPNSLPGIGVTYKDPNHEGAYGSGTIPSLTAATSVALDAATYLGNVTQPLAWQSQNIAANVSGLTQFQNDQAYAAKSADMNLSLANYANKGDYRNAVKGVQAAYADAELNPPSTVGQLGGDGFRWSRGLTSPVVNFKCVTGGAVQSLFAYWGRYGYQVNRFLWQLSGRPLKDLKVMSKYSYWQLQETYLTCASANESETAAIRGVFEKGVTLWNSPDMIGTTNWTDNEPKREWGY